MCFEQELERYSRQIILSEVGLEGQEKLKNAKVLIIGGGDSAARLDIISPQPVQVQSELLILTTLGFPIFRGKLFIQPMMWVNPRYPYLKKD